jgi:hypothetical protein
MEEEKLGAVEVNESTVSFDAMERLLVMNTQNGFLPEKGSMMDMRIVSDIIEKISLAQKEYIEIEAKSDESGGMKLNLLKAKELKKEIVFTRPELILLKKQVDKLDKKEMITPNIFGVANKILDCFTEKAISSGE